MLRFSFACVSAAALCCFSGLASGQTLGWLPMADLPPTRSELEGDPIPPAVWKLREWDPDAHGPQSSRIVVCGVMLPTFAGGRYVAQLTDEGWSGLNTNTMTNGGSPNSMEIFREPGQSAATVFVGFSQGPIRRYDDGVWTTIANIPSPKTMCVGDLDGPDGPEPECLFIGGNQGVYQWDGLILRQLVGGASAAQTGGLYVWDSDGDGPQSPQLYAAPWGSANRGLRVWTGNAWIMLTTLPDACYAIGSFDFDGDGPGRPDLLLGQSGSVKKWSQGAVSHVGDFSPNDSGIVYSIVPFDPDGPGNLPTQLIAAGAFSSIGGVGANKIAAYYDSQWHALPPYVGGIYATASVATDLPYSNSAQLLVGIGAARPCIGRFGLCDGPAGIHGDAPTRSRQPEGQAATFDVIPSGDELTFRWYKGNTALVDGATAHGSTLSGAYGPRLAINNVRAQDAGDYHVVVFNPLGQARSRDVSLSLGCPTDFNLDDVVDISDYLDYIAAFATSDPDADFNADRVIDFFDYLDFVNQFASGC